MDRSTSWNEIVDEPAWQDGLTERELYLRFHPVDHLHFAWLRGKQPGRYVGATHLTHQRYGGAGPLMRAAITLLDPAERSGAETVVCASVHLVDENGQEGSAEAARFVHVALARDCGTELRSAWWVPVDETTDLEWITTGRLRHVHEEFAHIADFLPGVFREP